MRKRRTKLELSSLYEEVNMLLQEGYDPRAIRELTKERRDLLSGIIAKIFDNKRNMEYKCRIISSNTKICEFNNESSQKYYKFEMDNTGSIILIPINI